MARKERKDVLIYQYIFSKLEMEIEIKEPIIYHIEDNREALEKFKVELECAEKEQEKKIILEYPTVYIHNYPESNQYKVYIGESYDIIKRTIQHLEAAENKNKWQKILKEKKTSLYIIGHEHFNKSLTLDIENRLMLYMLSVQRVKKIYNK